jgi:hypothetical protein
LEHALASAYLNDQRIEIAIEILEHVVVIQKETLDEKDHFRLTSEHELARAYLNNRQVENAIEILEYVVVVQKETLDEKDHFRLNSEHLRFSMFIRSSATLGPLGLEPVLRRKEEEIIRGIP